MFRILNNRGGTDGSLGIFASNTMNPAKIANPIINGARACAEPQPLVAAQVNPSKNRITPTMHNTDPK